MSDDLNIVSTATGKVSVNGIPVPDDLRTRISDVQLTHIPVDYAGYIDCSCGVECKPEHGGIDVAEQMWGEHVADAVIRELARQNSPATTPDACVMTAGWMPTMSESNESQKLLGFDLRERIAAVVDPMIDPPCCDECKPFRASDFAFEVADAVIRKLGLRDEQLTEQLPPHRTIRRVVSDWKADRVTESENPKCRKTMTT